MPLPIATRNVHISIVDPPSGVEAVGTVTFQLAFALYDQTGDIILRPGRWVATLANGEATIALPVNDQAGVSVQGWSYKVWVQVGSGNDTWTPTGSIAIPTGVGDVEFADEFQENINPSGSSGGSGSTVTSVNGQTGTVVLTAASLGAVLTSRTIAAGTGLSGGGDLSSNRTISASFGSTAGTITEGNDARFTSLATDITERTSAFVWNAGTVQYDPAPNAGIYVGPTDPGAVPDGSIWFDTSA